MSDEQVRACRNCGSIFVRFTKGGKDDVADDVPASRAPVHDAAEDGRVGNINVRSNGMKRNALSLDQFAIARRGRNHRGMPSALYFSRESENWIDVAERTKRAENNTLSVHKTADSNPEGTVNAPPAVRTDLRCGYRVQGPSTSADDKPSNVR